MGDRLPQSDLGVKHGQEVEIRAAQAKSFLLFPNFAVLGLASMSSCAQKPSKWRVQKFLEQDTRVGIRSQPNHINQWDFRG